VTVRWIVGELKTGRITATLPLVDPSWSMVLDDAGTLSGSLTLTDATVRALNPRAAVEPGRMFLAAVWEDPTSGDETILEAGPVWTHEYNGADKSLKVGGSGLWSYYDHRKVVGVLTASQTAATVTYETGPTSLGTVAKRLIALAHTHTNGSVPVVLPDDVAGDQTRTYPGSELAWVGAKLRELTQGDDGPEIAFIPRFKADDRYIEWVLTTGTPVAPMLTQSGQDWVWDTTVPASPVIELSVVIDGTGLASRAWVAGASVGNDRLIVSRDDTTLTAGGWPLLEIEADGLDTVTTTTQLAAVARQAVASARMPIQTWTLKVRGAARPTPGMLRPGHWARVVIGDQHPYLGGGEFRGRVVQVAGGSDDAMSVQFQPEAWTAASPVIVVETPTATEPQEPDPEEPSPPPEEPEAPEDPDPPVEGDQVTWSSGAFLMHNAGLVNGFATFRDRPLQNIAVFPTHNTQAAIANMWWLGSSYIPSGFTGDISIAMPMCADSQSVSTNISSEVTAVANALRDYGDNRCLIRIGWEMNLHWAWKVTDGNLATWKSRFGAYADIFHSILGTRAVVVWNPNIGPNQSGLSGSIEQAWVDGKIDAAGPDAYDCWPPFTNSTNISFQLNTTYYLNWYANLCRTKGVRLCLPEWGVSSGTQWAGNCGNDNPLYIETMFDWLVGNADIALFDSYFSETASYLRSDLWRPTGAASNPTAGARYADLFARP
jgi:hypothetical protein